MDKKNITVYSMMKRYCDKKNTSSRYNYKEHNAVRENDLLKYEKNLMSDLQTDTSKKYTDYVNRYLDTQEHSGNPVNDISIDKETISQMTNSITDILRNDFDFVEEIVLNKEDDITNGILMYDIFNSFIRTLLLTELFLNRRINYDINYQNIPSISS